MFPPASSLFFLLVLRLSSLVEAQPVQLYHTCDAGGNFTANSTYQSNLDRLLTTLPSNGSASGFLKDTKGHDPDQVSGLVLCRGDINATACCSCLNTAVVDVRRSCAYKKAAAVWYDVCFLRFSNQRSILSNTDFSSKLSMGNLNNATQLDRFNHLLDLLLNNTADLTVNSSKRFATAEVSNYTSEFPTIYGLMQCMPDMSMTRCSQCLRGMFEPLPNWLEGKRGGRVLGFSCNMRYEVYPFYQGTPTVKITAPPPSGNATEPAAAPVSPPLPPPAPSTPPSPLPSPSPSPSAPVPPLPPPTPPLPLPAPSPSPSPPPITTAATAIAIAIAIAITACC